MGILHDLFRLDDSRMKKDLNSIIIHIQDLDSSIWSQMLRTGKISRNVKSYLLEEFKKIRSVYYFTMIL